MHNSTNKLSEKTIIGSLHDSDFLKQAVGFIKEGYCVGVFNRGVCALWGDGQNSNFYTQVLKIKGEKRGQKPLATTLRTKEFISFIDKTKVPVFLHEIILNPEKLVSRIGSLCFVRAPIKQNLAKKFPSYLVSKTENETFEMQNWDAYGHDPTHKFIELLRENNINLPAVTSMNLSGEPEIVDQKHGIEFAKKNRIKMFLIDEKDPGKIKGSFTILSITQDGLILTRDGNIPGHVFPHLLENEINMKNSAPSKFPQITFPKDFFEGIDPEQARKKIISFVYMN